jgi:uncharacterized YigZ family protein
MDEGLDSFRTIQLPSQGLYKEKGSKFLAFAYPVRSEEEVQKCLDALRKQYYDARHHCYAWVLGPKGDRVRANDDGEPNHSAGDPILGQIKSFQLTNVLVVVVRYFGGTKLGVGGLISAYRTAALEALTQAEVIEEIILEELRLEFSYHETTEVMRAIKEADASIIQQEYLANCVLQVGVRQRLLPAFLAKIELLNHLGHQITLSEL